MLIWPFIPQGATKEVLEFKTEVMRTRTTEQRLALYAEPLIHFDYNFQFLEGEVEAAISLSKQHGNEPIILPLWEDLYDYGRNIGSLAQDDTVINFEYEYRRFNVGKYLMIYDDNGSFEIAVVSELNTTSITLETGLTTDYNSPVIIPCCSAYIDGTLPVAKYSADFYTAACSFVTDEDLGSSLGYPYNFFNGYRLFSNRSEVTGGLQESAGIDKSSFTNPAGKLHYEVEYPLGRSTSSINLTFLNKTSLHAFIKWLYALRGKLYPFYMPMWTKDFIPAQNILSADNTIVVNLNTSKATEYTGAICIVKTDGTLIPLLVNAIINTTETTLQLSGAVGQDINISDIELICRMPLMRSNTDRFEISYNMAGESFIKIPLIETES